MRFKCANRISIFLRSRPDCSKPSVPAYNRATSRACQAADFDSVNTNEILVALWEKFVLMGTNSAVASLTRLPFGNLREDPEVFALFEKGFAEVAAVGRARG